MILPVATTPEADSQIRTIDDWWRKNGGAPLIGRRYQGSPIPGTRRLLLRATRFHIYYVPDEREVVVLAVWHAERGAGPPLMPR